MLSLSLTDAAIISTALEAILYGQLDYGLVAVMTLIESIAHAGFSILMFIFTMWIVLQNRRRRRLNRGMLGAGCALLILSTAVCCNLCFARMIPTTATPGNDCEHHAGEAGFFDGWPTAVRRAGAILRGRIDINFRRQKLPL
jgi:hypothetical protein